MSRQSAARTYTCEWCGKPFTQKNTPKVHAFCSKSCSTKYAWTERKTRDAPRTLDRATEMTRIGNRFGRTAREAGLSREAFEDMTGAVMRIAEMEYTVGGRTHGPNTAAQGVDT